MAGCPAYEVLCRLCSNAGGTMVVYVLLAGLGGVVTCLVTWSVSGSGVLCSATCRVSCYFAPECSTGVQVALGHILVVGS